MARGGCAGEGKKPRRGGGKRGESCPASGGEGFFFFFSGVGRLEEQGASSVGPEAHDEHGRLPSRLERRRPYGVATPEISLLSTIKISNSQSLKKCPFNL